MNNGCDVKKQHNQSEMTAIPTYHLSQSEMRLINFLKPSGYFTYHKVQYSKILRGAPFALSVLCGSQNIQRLLLYTSLTDWLL